MKKLTEFEKKWGVPCPTCGVREVVPWSASGEPGKPSKCTCNKDFKKKK